MASSSYYWRRYREERDKAKEYKKDKEELEDILKDVEKSFDDEIRAVNRELEDCEEDLVGDGVRHISSFDTNQSDALRDCQEKSVWQDRSMSDLRSALGKEISALRRKQEAAESAAEDYRERAKEAEREEAREREEKLKEAISSLFPGI